MQSLYHQTCMECAELITKRYSTSFSLGIRAFAPALRPPIYGIYGFVRFADEIVDTFHEADKPTLLAKFRQDTQDAITQKLSFNPVLHAFQLVVNQYNIDWHLIDAFLVSMEMDLHKTQYQSQEDYQQYIYGSAEVIGLMCLRIFVNGNSTEYERLTPTARSLGSAFQKINFLRDIQSDFEERGRVYFPNVDFRNFTDADKKAIEADIAKEFAHALEGIKQLPKASQLGVYLAYTYYTALFDKIKACTASSIATKRIRVPDTEKLWLYGKVKTKYTFGTL